MVSLVDLRAVETCVCAVAKVLEELHRHGGVDLAGAGCRRGCGARAGAGVGVGVSVAHRGRTSVSVK